jgi:hypothetical protein
MNERIKELMAEANLFCRTDGTVSSYGEKYAGQDDIQQFIELIVKECADRIDDLVTCDGDGNQILDCDDVRTELLEHFGVEE